MADELLRYYRRKQNLASQDEFHERIESRDIDQLNKASIYMMMAPILTSAIVYGYSKMRESGGASSHLAQAIATAKEKFTPQTWGA